MEIQAKIHDRFTLELKVGFFTRKKHPTSEFAMNTWIFIPNSLDINPKSYTKQNFYKDMRSNVRLRTPQYSLHELAGKDCYAFQLLEDACERLAYAASEENIYEFEYNLKMFASIVKSGIRDSLFSLEKEVDAEDFMTHCRTYAEDIQTLCFSFRKLRGRLTGNTIPQNITEHFDFGDEFISNVVEQHLFRLIHLLEKHPAHGYKEVRAFIHELLAEELSYKRSKGYLVVEEHSADNNRTFVFRSGLLKKYVESDLYLEAKKQKNTFVMEQILYGLAAGLSMVFATVISFSFQQKYGNFTTPFFLALVISYMLKDRIKELMRYYFAHKMGSKFFDYRTRISIKEHLIGWSKEGFDFIRDEKIPPLILQKRGRSSLLEAGNQSLNEKIILYRKRVLLHLKAVNRISPFPLLGINDIIRFNLSEYIRKMDNSEVPLYAHRNKPYYVTVKGEKIYYLNVVIECHFEQQVKYTRYRICMNREGILGVEEL